jgi:hypothetical protein
VKKVLATSFVLATMLAFSPGFAHADSLVGQPGYIQYLWPTVGDPYLGRVDFVAGAGVQTIGDLGMNVNIYGDNLLQVAVPCRCFFTEVPFNGLQIHFPDYYITSASFLSTTGLIIGFDGSRVTFDEHNIFLNWQGAFVNTAGSFIEIEVNGTSASPVPEPGTMVLLGTGLLGLRFRRFRKN